MGLTHSSVGHGAAESCSTVLCGKGIPVAMAGNPNVGKSTVFNALTGMNQHTGNWAGKTVAVAGGTFESDENIYTLVDIPGTYSLLSKSKEEEVARDLVCFGNISCAVVVCDATCLERNMNLVLQVAEVAPRTVMCINLMDEAARRGISIDIEMLSRRLGIPVCGVCARKKKTLCTLGKLLDGAMKSPASPMKLSYPAELEAAIAAVEARLRDSGVAHHAMRWLAVRLLENDPSFEEKLVSEFKNSLNDAIETAKLEREKLQRANLPASGMNIKDTIAATVVRTCENICDGAVTTGNINRRDRILDKVFTGRLTAFPVMLLLLAFIFWITLKGANYPSAALSGLLLGFQDSIHKALLFVGLPEIICDAAVYGAYRMLAWVVSVMLVPMAIFFPLFTLLEDLGYLPRVAYDLDKPFRMCGACGKQALTMCMGFGCNAAGVVGCRIIDSPRERLLAVLTNNFVPCNGRFPMMITVIGIFFCAGRSGAVSAIILCAVILTGICATFAATKLLSATLLKGTPSSFTLELPSYRMPQVGQVIVRSIFDRTLFVLGRAAAVAAPAGLLVWMLANINAGGASLLSHMSAFLDPAGRLMGLDGVILLAFILGFPANETVIPIMLMTYLSSGAINETGGIEYIGTVMINNGWNGVTAICFLLFSLMHWPCSTTLLTVAKETHSVKWTLCAAILPTAFGVLCCITVNAIAGMIW